MNNSEQILLVIAPHPDDEVLGCGGLISKVKNEGGKVFVLYLTVGDTNDFSQYGLSTAKERLNEIEKVIDYLKIDGYKIAFPGNQFHLKLDSIAQKDIIEAIEDGEDISINKIKPTILAIPSAGDYHQDHKACTEAAAAATRPGYGPLRHSPNIILGYEYGAIGHWSVLPKDDYNFFIKLEEQDLKTKVTAMDLYSSQARKGIHPRSNQIIESLAHLRGAQCGGRAAEAFHNFQTIL
jgi:LmbE family N-acetylglucosaminyl deacetylase